MPPVLPEDLAKRATNDVSPRLASPGMKRYLIALAAMTLALAGCGEREQSELPAEAADPGLIHIHGLGFNPADQSLYIATHTGLFRVEEDEQQAERVGQRQQDTMGFSVVGPDRFLGSGHPDAREDLPPFLGLIESEDAGASWAPVSLLGKTDFHVLEASKDHVYGFGSDFDSRSAIFLASVDSGRTWQERSVPDSLVALAIDPADPLHVVASGERRMFASTDEGRTWRPLADEGGLLAWSAADQLHAVGLDGSSARSDDGGRTWTDTASVGGAPAAFESAGDVLYVALHDGTVKQSTDGGQTWTVRATP